MQYGAMVQLGEGCPRTTKGVHQVEDWCRVCGEPAGVGNLIDGCEQLEWELTMGNYIGWQDGKWWLFRHDGEGLQSGDSLEQLLRHLSPK